MTIQSVAIVFDNTLRPETTGLYCRRALGELVQVEHFLKDEVDQIQPDKFDLLLQIDDGFDYVLPDCSVPKAVWVIDTHIDFESALRKAKAADFVFAAQKDGAEKLRAHGIAAEWMPLACDPEIHRPHDVAGEYNACFVGNVLPGPRKDLLDAVSERFPGTFIGQRYFDEMAKTYSASKVVLNRSVANDVNMRVFEALACGSLLLTNDLSENGQAELFESDVHLVAYKSQSDFFDKLDWLLRDETARQRIAAAGRREVLAHHTYRHRMERILEVAGAAEPSSCWGNVSAAPGATKDRSYFEHTRPEILERIPKDATDVLDVGCGAGRLGAALKARQTCHVTGIELNETAADHAGEHLDEVLCENVESPECDFAAGAFDAIVCGDILEHLREPAAFLKKARKWLKPGGRLIASLPNVRHHTVIRSLLEGNWTYEPAGLLDDDHVRFFTKNEIEKLFFRTGFEVEASAVIPGPGHADWVAAGRPREIQVGGLSYRARDASDGEELFAYQYLIEALPAEEPQFGKTSIVIVTHNQLHHTQACLDSIRHVTDEPYELIVVDNGSTDGTPEYLKTQSDVRLIENEENRGFPAAVNQGLAVASGDNLLLLNNDTVVTTGWLRRMLTALNADEQLALVGPVSNNVSGEQRIVVDYDDAASIDGFGWRRGREYSGQTFETDRLVGFCLLFSRELFDEVGGLDERFGIGNFEDDDFCRRALAAGFKANIALDAFVHHVGGATFRDSGINFSQLMRENKQKLDEKWGAGGSEQLLASVEDESPAPSQTSKTSTPSFRLESVESGGLKLAKGGVRLSLCMIVRDNAQTIGPALTSIKPFVDEMIVVDTGSKDETPEICRKLGAKVHEFPWCDDFSAARNESLRLATGDWIFWMDSDDTIPAECGQKLRALADTEHADDCFGYVMQVRCPSAGHPDDVTVVDHVKLIRNRPDLRFEHRIHEQILPAIRRAGGRVAFTDIYVDHSGSDQTAEGRVKKLERDYRLLKLDLKERPDHPFVLFNLGMTYADDEKHELATGFLKQCLKVSSPGGSHLRKAYSLLVGSLVRLGRHAEALEVSKKGLIQFPNDKELQFRQAVLLMVGGDAKGAIAAYRKILSGSDERHFASVDAGLSTFKTRHNLACILEQTGQFEEAKREWETVVTRQQPTFRPAWRGLTELAFKACDDSRLSELQRRMAEYPELEPELAILAARCKERDGDIEEAGRLFFDAEQRFPDDADVLRAVGRFLFERRGPEAAESVLERLAKLDSRDGSVLQNLGAVCLITERFEQAAKRLEQAAKLTPNKAATWQLLGHALEKCGRKQDAETAWKRARELAPEHGKQTPFNPSKSKEKSHVLQTA